MGRFFLFGGVLALLAVGAIIAKIPKRAVAQHHEPIDPAILSGHLQKLQGEEALP